MCYNNIFTSKDLNLFRFISLIFDEVLSPTSADYKTGESILSQCVSHPYHGQVPRWSYTWRGSN